MAFSFTIDANAFDFSAGALVLSVVDSSLMTSSGNIVGSCAIELSTRFFWSNPGEAETSCFVLRKASKEATSNLDWSHTSHAVGEVRLRFSLEESDPSFRVVLEPPQGVSSATPVQSVSRHSEALSNLSQNLMVMQELSKLGLSNAPSWS